MISTRNEIIAKNETNKGIFIYDDDLDEESDPDIFFNKSLCYLYLSLGSQKLSDKKSCGDELHEFFVRVTKTNLKTGQQSVVGEENIFPSNYCTPFEKSYTFIYFNFDSIDSIREYLKRNELKIILISYKGNEDPEVLFQENATDIIKPVTNIEKQNILINNKNNFKIRLRFKVEWYAIIPKKFPESKINKVLNKKQKDNQLLKNSQDENLHWSIYDKQLVICSMLNLPNNIYQIYENGICGDPLVSLEKKKNLKLCELSENNNGSKNEIYSKNSEIGFKNEVGSWSIKMKQIVLKEEGFMQIYDRFPKYRQSKTFKVFFQHYIQDENKKNLTPIRGHWSILDLKKRSNNKLKLGFNFPNDKFYITNLNIYSRIPEVITEDVNNKYLFVRCILPKYTRLNEENINDFDILFIGKLLLNQISNKLLIKLYNSTLNNYLGYIFIEISSIKEYTYIDKNNLIEQANTLNDKIINKREISINDRLEEISLIFIYIYWHIQMRSKIENESPKKLILEFYSKLVSISDYSYINIKGLTKCINALIPSDHFYFKFLINKISKIPNDLVLIRDIQELINHLLFPHLEILEDICRMIFSYESAYEMSGVDFIKKCVELGVRESISTIWYDMIRNTFKQLTLKTCQMCVKRYRTENIFN